MTPTLVVLRVEGHGMPEALSLHVKREQAERRLVEVADELWQERFGYRLSDSGQPVSVVVASDRLVAEGWRVRITDEPVEL